MLLTTLFSLPVDVYLADVSLEKETLTLVLKSSQTSAICPECAHPSTRIRGRYTRTLADLPCQGRTVRVHLEVRRFVCATRGCPRTTFAERFPRLARAYGRRTLRQAEALTEVAFAVGGKAGAREASRLAMPTSRDTRLWLIRSAAVPQRKIPQVLLLDDFAWKKGDRYGTLLVDLQAHCPVEVLAPSGSGHRRPLAARASGREDHQSRPRWDRSSGSQTRGSARQASRLLATISWSTRATRSKVLWLESLRAGLRWQQREGSHAPPPSLPRAPLNLPTCLMKEGRRTSQQALRQTKEHQH